MNQQPTEQWSIGDLITLKIVPWLYVIGGVISLMRFSFPGIFFEGSFVREGFIGGFLVAVCFAASLYFSQNKTDEWIARFCRYYTIALLFHAFVTVPIERVVRYCNFYALHHVWRANFAHLIATAPGDNNDFFMMASLLVAGIFALVSFKLHKNKAAGRTAWISVSLFLYFVSRKD